VTAPRPRLPSPFGRLFRDGQPWVWITRVGTAVLILMVVGIVGIVLVNGLGTFWPKRLVRYELKDGTVVVGEETKREVRRVGDAGTAEEQVQVRIGNRDQLGLDFAWLPVPTIASESRPEDLLSFERMEHGPAYGRVHEVTEDGKVVASGPGAAAVLRARLDAAAARRDEIEAFKRRAISESNERIEEIRLARRRAELEHAAGSEALAKRLADLDRESAEAQEGAERLAERMRALRREDLRHQVRLEDGAGKPFKKPQPISTILRVDEPNALSFPGQVLTFVGRFWRFVTENPREANTDGGVWPALFGTMLMTLLMTFFVVPFGVLAALYLREYAKQGAFVSAVRVAVNNLAGVPSIVFGVFGLGFFCYLVGGWIDHSFFAERLPSPTFGGGGILWASLTLALLTVPVVIVATEEALAAVPKSLREAAIACGASKWQTIRRVVLPHASPGILTGMILAMARGAGEVAPLMLTGVVKLAHELPLDAEPPFLHPERRFMHLGFHIYDTAFQSPNVDASTPLVYSTTLVLLVLVLVLNLGATLLRNRLRRKFRTGVFG
jgi:phosphate transport system permease protein